MQVPGLGEGQSEPFRPLHRQQRPDRSSVFLLLEKNFIGRGGLLQPVEIEVNQRWSSLGVVLCQVGSEGAGGLQVVERPGPIATFRVEQARSLGVSAEIPVHVLPTELKIHGGSAHNHS